MPQCVQPWSRRLFPSHAMEKALGKRLIVCCLEVLPLRPFTFFVYCRMRSLILPGPVGRSVGKEKKAPRKWRSLELGGPVPQYNLTVLQGKLAMCSNYV